MVWEVQHAWVDERCARLLAWWCRCGWGNEWRWKSCHLPTVGVGDGEWLSHGVVASALARTHTTPSRCGLSLLLAEHHW